ncbi:Chromate resistance protein ChrB [Nocardioides sp. zg-1230]|uniref:Chromate resistance protein ChrB n=1 Tax=Nocardioides sp. zg-1230 TaxID=2736601 RepID=UPI0020A680A0|nr:Chromate resistance protein ChrB [Nocardioides sp. zg-1230]
MSWVVLIHRVPREPSTPRISIWRKLRALGVAQLSDGTVALPEDARTREQLEWVADQVVQAGGTALLLRAQPLAGRDERALAAGMAEARAQEYRELAAAVATAAAADSTPAEGARTVRRLRKELRAIQRRDFFPPPERDAAAAAVADLAAKLTQPEAVAPRRAAADRTRSRA